MIAQSEHGHKSTPRALTLNCCQPDTVLMRGRIIPLMEKQPASSGRRVWKVRIKKLYPTATNHVVVGEVLEETVNYVKMRCRAFHFHRPTSSSSIISGDIGVRVFPWSSIAYATEIDADSSWEHVQASLDENFNVVLALPAGRLEMGLSDALDV